VTALILQDLDELKRRLAPHLQRARKVVAFGSEARGESDQWSDLDLLIVAETPRLFLDCFKDFADLYNVWPRLDLLIYTPAELERVIPEENLLVLRAEDVGPFDPRIRPL